MRLDFDFLLLENPRTFLGALISFALVGGKVQKTAGKSRKRYPMTVEEVFEMYSKATPNIFQVKGRFKRMMNWISAKMSGLPIYPYDQDGITGELKKVYDSATLKDFDGQSCIAAAVARKFDYRSKDNVLEIFDTKSKVSHPVVQVLKASANAPFYFNTPTEIGDFFFVDGGVGGNCPLAQAVPRMRELFRFGSLNSILSIAPPQCYLGKIPQKGQAMFWMQYFPFQFTDGGAVYDDTKKHYPSSIFQRLHPKSKEAEAFAMDELNIDAMVAVLKQERINDQGYFQDVLASAVVITARVIDNDNLDSFSLTCKQMIEWALATNRNETALNISRVLTKIYYRKTNQQVNYAKALFYFGTSFFAQEKFQQAKTELRNCNQILKDVSDFSDFRVKALVKLGRCYLQLGDFTNAEESLLEALELQDWSEAKGQTLLDESLTYLSKVQLELGKFEEALSNASKAMEMKDANNVDAQIHLGFCYMRMEQFTKAIQQFELVKIDELDQIQLAVMKSYQGHCNLSLGQINRALIFHKNALEIAGDICEKDFDPRIIDVYFLSGVAFLEAGNYEEALSNLEKGLKLSTDIYEAIHEGHPSIALHYLMIGKLNVHRGVFEEAKDLLQNALQMQKRIFIECKNEHVSMAQTYGVLANAHLLIREFEQALNYVDLALEIIMVLLPNSFTHGHLLRIKAEIILGQNNDSSLASDYLQKSLAILENHIGKGSKHQEIPAIMIAQAKVAFLNEQDPFKTIDEALNFIKELYGSTKHVSYALALECKAVLILETPKGDHVDGQKSPSKEATKLLKQALRILEDKLGTDEVGYQHEPIARISNLLQKIEE